MNHQIKLFMKIQVTPKNQTETYYNSNLKSLKK